MLCFCKVVDGLGVVTSSGPGSLEPVDFSPVGALNEFVASAQRFQPKLLGIQVSVAETAL